MRAFPYGWQKASHGEGWGGDIHTDNVIGDGGSNGIGDGGTCVIAAL